ncbi:unnamed protein product [Amoebophrya sp. A120]|nr:unnamed protein product [Amoebophrya sp. A120]|eukprot:GSA120T00020202001.1
MASPQTNSHRFFLLALGSTVLPGVSADLPVHCLRHQVEGDWTFYLSEPSPERSSCGHGRPDNEKREPNPRDLVVDSNAGGGNRQMKVSLSMPNRAQTDTDVAGTFTMIYDEGFEVAVDNKVFFAFSRFDLDALGRNQTKCDETLTGWYHDRDGGNYGCYYGRKNQSPQLPNDLSSSEESSTASTSSSPEVSMASDNMNDLFLHSLGREEQSTSNLFGHEDSRTLDHTFHESVVNRLNDFSVLQETASTKRTATSHKRLQKSKSTGGKTWTAEVYANMVGKTRKELNKMAGIKRRLPLAQVKKNQRRLRSTSNESTTLASSTSFLQRDASTTTSHTTRSKISDFSELPPEFDWEEKGVLDDVVNQGDCGSCFTVATIRMLSARNRVRQRNNNLEPFSIAFPLHCSEYNQGCNGGYAFLQSKWSEDVGLIPAKCMQYSTASSCADPISLDCVKGGEGDANSAGSYRAVNHRYIGGYYGGSDELDIMQELVDNGPVVVSFEPKDDFMYYNQGVYQSTSGEPIHQEWERVDHAVLLVGYGVDSTSGQKYWKVQNSWGPEWGEGGFFRIARGTNDSGIESISVAADVEPMTPSSSSVLENFLKNRNEL